MLKINICNNEVLGEKNVKVKEVLALNNTVKVVDKRKKNSINCIWIENMSDDCNIREICNEKFNK